MKSFLLFLSCVSNKLCESEWATSSEWFEGLLIILLLFLFEKLKICACKTWNFNNSTILFPSMSYFTRNCIKIPSLLLLLQLKNLLDDDEWKVWMVILLIQIQQRVCYSVPYILYKSYCSLFLKIGPLKAAKRLNCFYQK